MEANLTYWANKNYPTTSLINSSKNKIVRMSKHILDQIDIELVSKLGVKERKTTANVIKLFKNINPYMHGMF